MLWVDIKEIIKLVGYLCKNSRAKARQPNKVKTDVRKKNKWPLIFKNACPTYSHCYSCLPHVPFFIENACNIYRPNTLLPETTLTAMNCGSKKPVFSMTKGTTLGA